MRSKEDFILTGRNHKTGGVEKLNGKQYTEFAVSDSEYADDTAIPFTSRSDAEILHCCSWNIFEDGDLMSMQALTAPTKNLRRNFYFVQASLDLPRQSNSR